MKKILVCLLVLGLIGIIGLNVLGEKNVKAEEYQVEELINQLFNERVNLLSSKDLEEFDKKTNEIKIYLSPFFIYKDVLEDSLMELRELYGMVEGYQK